MNIQILPLGAYQTNCYLLYTQEGGVCAVIDPGDQGDVVVQAIEKLGCTLQGIYLTHGHHDHTGGVAALCAQYPGTPVYLHPKDGREATAAMRTIVPELTVETLDYVEGDTFTLGDVTFTVLETPGHTPGSVVLYCEGALFAGDTLFAGSCGRTDFPGSNHKDMMASLRRLSTLEGQVFPGHMGYSTMEQERRSNPYLRQAMQG